MIKRLFNALKIFGCRYLLFKILLVVNPKNYNYYILLLLERDKAFNRMKIDALKNVLQYEYSHITGSYNDIEHPLTYNDKIQWLKLYDLSELKTILSDKFLVRNWISDKIGEEYLTNLLGVWDSVDRVDFSCLPNQFCLKANHGSGMCYVVKDKSKLKQSDLVKIRDIMNIWMRTPFYAQSIEFQYKNISRKIIAEEYIVQMDGDLKDYKIHCFNGVPRIIQVIGERNLSSHTGKEAFFDKEWNRIPLMYHTYEQYNKSPQRPDNLFEMLKLAGILSSGFKYVRVDFYNIDGAIKFGEMTFTPASGYGQWTDEIYNLKVGEMLSLE